ncbi:hypothetical protein PAXRUDRAFT_823613 [Paxillus rubicundulus Ve08.2h10]|uniref:SH3 domain-containing protein n=1 Tax=Paxillus rubicundulus Ve08.2h10 TaxID=930991 RepID=A0A0D0DVC9_9AGAM|nr:hypothetical protein PAXRUDRAFT_823613 [Paxillus rubicundulus Ve08.2h10]
MTEPRSPIFAHILSQTRQNVELLIAHNQILEVDGREILSRLSSAGNSSESLSVVVLTNQTQSLTMSPPRSVALTVPPKVEARAIWEWTSEDSNDLAFHAGEIIEIVAETNADWWTGRNTAGKQGLFPAIYVEKLPQHLRHRPLSQLSFPDLSKSKTSLDSRTGSMEPRYPSPQPKQYPPPAPQQFQPPPGAPRTGSVELRYPSPQPKQYPSPAPPQQYSPPAGAAGYYPPGGPSYNPYMAPPSGPPAPQPMPQQQPPPQKNKFGGLGQTMAQSAAGGVGFGAGAAIGGGLINSIF